jgi:hypothetical protein
VHILHYGTTARVAFNGWHISTFPVQPGVFQGSPLSPLLFVLAAQPMAAHARRTAAALQPRHLSSGDLQPVMHQHADDTTIHAATTADAQVLLTSSMDLRCRATGDKLQRGKTIGLGLGSASHLADVTTGVTFAAPHTCIRHLGIFLQRDAEAAPTQLYTGILQKLRARIARWSGFQLSLLGRSYVAAVAALYPVKSTCYRDFAHGSIRLVDIRSQLTALQAKIIGRFLEPEYIPWKAYLAFWLYRPRDRLPVSCLSQQQHV